MPTDPIVILFQNEVDFYINQLVGKIVNLTGNYPKSTNAFTQYVTARLADEFRAQLVDNEFN